MSTPKTTQTAAARPTSAEETAKYYRIRRNDGRWALNYTYDSKSEAERDAAELHSESHPFTYRIEEVRP